MKKKIITALVLLSLLFMLTAGLIIAGLLATTAELRDIITLHQIDATRQELNVSVEKIKSYVHGSPDLFARNLDDIVESGKEIDAIIGKCHSCHHTPEVLEEIVRTEKMVAAFKEGLSSLITSVSEDVWRNELQLSVAVLGDDILRQVQAMLARAGGSIQRHTAVAMEHINLAYRLLLVTAILTVILAVFLSRWLLARVTTPIDRLLVATRKIADGELGVRAEREAVPEFVALIDTFNEMSATLGVKEKQIQDNLRRLNELHQVTLPLHAAHDLAVITSNLGIWLANLVMAEHRGIVLRTGDGYQLHLCGEREILASGREIPAATVESLFRQTEGKPLFAGGEGEPPWPFGGEGGELPPKGVAVWLVADQRLEGALVVMSGKPGGFREEEVKILGLLANNLAVALVNIGLYGDLKLQMEELRKAQQQLIQAEKLTAVGTLAGGIAHDFNNILCGMLGHIALLKRAGGGVDSPAALETIEIIEQAGFRAANLTKQLLTFSRQGIWEKQPVNLNRKVSDVLSLFEKTVSKLIAIRMKLDEDLPAILGDPGQIEQVIMNLCVNARDAMPAGGTLTIGTDRFTGGQSVDDLPPGDYVRLCVTDTGVGMEAAVVPRIFEPFFTTKEMGKGTGLGLAMVYGIVKRHGGICRVTSSPGQGATFTVYFPVAEQAIEYSPPAACHAARDKYGVLIVDDEAAIASMLERYLREDDWKVYTAANGQAAIEVLAAHWEEIDLVVLDVNMPVMGGEETFHRLKAVKPNLKVLVVSGYNIEENVRSILEAGADDFIQKPFRLEDLLTRMSGVFEKQSPVK